MDTGKKRILCADADEDHRSLESALLRAAGYEVVTAEGISDALRIARGVGFDLYLVAYKLQDGTGLELCKRLREFDGVTPVFFFSARVYEMDVRGRWRPAPTLSCASLMTPPCWPRPCRD